MKKSSRCESEKSDGQADQAAECLSWSIETNGTHISVFTLVLWLLITAVSALGFVLHYERPQRLPRQDFSIVAQALQVELTQEQVPVIEPDPVPQPIEEPGTPDELIQPTIAQPIAVAKPSPVIAFPLPVEGPTRIVEAKRADYIVPPITNTATAFSDAPATQTLVLGHGEGKQPAPEYPDTARRLGQEGSVLVRLTVGENGRVIEADAKIASPWPLLNQAALRTVKDRWQFNKGPVRIFEVGIRFELKKRTLLNSD
jgi:periplasmic protein TonB